MKGTHLGEFEELVLLTVAILNDEAYGFTITEEIEKNTGRTISMRAVHTALYRLEEKGLAKSSLGGATAQRGGRRKRMYSVTQQGKNALSEMKNVRNKMWEMIPKTVIPNGR